MVTTRTFDLLERYKEKFLFKTDALAGKENGVWVKYSSQDYIDNCYFISCGLLALGLKKGDKVATVSNNRPEWNFLDLGMAQIGVIHVPLFTTLEEENYDYIIKHSDAKLLFVSDKAIWNKTEKLIGKGSLQNIYAFDDFSEAKSWKEVLELGKKNSDRKNELEEIKKAILPTDAVTLIYTSGTTGNSKGVVLMHQNLMSNSISVSKVFNLQPTHKYLSILPVCHVGERMGIYQTQYSGCSLYYAENIGTIARDLADVKPEGFGTVPRILEKVYDKIMGKAEQLKGIKEILFFWALNLGIRYERDGKNGLWYELQLWLANKIIFSKWRAALGGNIQSIGVGGAALSPKLERVFWAGKIKLLNMYGLTETSPVITINRLNSSDMKLGTVGCVLENVQLKFAADGEILCKGPNVMLGYFKDDKATAEAIDTDGWFHTGDIGVLEDGKYLKITDRKKEIFKLSNGKYVAPQMIENRFKESVYIDQLMVIGESEKHTSALISPNKEALRNWCKEKNINCTNADEMIAEPQVYEHYKNIVNAFNKQLSEDEHVKRFKLVKEEWTPITGELSPTLKLKRKVIKEKYKTLIDEIYNH
jgi:long-chain acyl-CoA synthetase